MDDNSLEQQPKSSRRHVFVYSFFALCFICITVYYLLSAPTFNRSIANGQVIAIHVAPNESLGEIANKLESKKIIKKAFVLKLLVELFGASHQIPRGDYVFKESMNTPRVAWMLARGNHNIDPIKITFKEGITNEEMATMISSKLLSFRRDLFLSDPKSKQGYLFPDTYFFFPMTTSDEIVDQMSSDFNNRIAPLKNDIENSSHSLDDIITMASLVQNEANGEADANIISGILWNRIKAGMPLQVDVSKETYNKAGLPTLPISNPGLVAIKAALNPQDSAFMYYLHDKDGMIHTARTFTEHKANINKYLR